MIPSFRNPSVSKTAKLRMARPIVTLRSLVGARSSSILPTGETRPIQLPAMMKMKRPANHGTYGRAASPPSESPKFSSDS